MGDHFGWNTHPNVLSGLRRQLHGRYEVTAAESGKIGLQKIRESKEVFPVIMSDFRMPEMDGVRFLAAARLISPDSVRIMLTGQADLHATIDAVNEGNIFRFLNKPCPPENLIRNLDACYSQYKLITAER